jgi:hypothetical protein
MKGLKIKRFSIILLIVVFALLLVLFGSGGCVSTQKLTVEDRRSDIEFLARWTRDYHPCVEVNKKHKGTPSYEALEPDTVRLKPMVSSPYSRSSLRKLAKMVKNRAGP